MNLWNATMWGDYVKAISRLEKKKSICTERASSGAATMGSRPLGFKTFQEVLKS